MILRRKPPTLILRNPGAVWDEVADLYGRAPFAQALADLIDGADPSGPLALGVSGRYGAGKSSVLAMLHQKLAIRARHRIIWVSCWRVGGSDQLLASILLGIVSSIRADWAGAWIRVTLAKAKRISAPAWIALLFPPFLLLAFWAALPERIAEVKAALSGDTAKLAVPVAVSTALAVIARAAKPMATVLGRGFEQPASEKAGALTRFAEEIEIFASVLPAYGRFVVFVEDLDRCTPSRALEMINALSQIAAHPSARHFCFVMAFDYAVVRDRLAEALKEGTEAVGPTALRAAEEHLRKALSLILNLPAPARTAAPRGGFLSRTRSRIVTSGLPLLDAIAWSAAAAWGLVWVYRGRWDGPPPGFWFPLLAIALAAGVWIAKRMARDGRNATAVSCDQDVLAAFRTLLPENLREGIVAENHGLAALRLWQIYGNAAGTSQWEILSTSAFLALYGALARPAALKEGAMAYREGADEFIAAGADGGKRSLDHCRSREKIEGFHRIFAALSDIKPQPPTLPPV